MGAYKRYREFGGKEQQEEPRVREFREFGTASLRGITVCSSLKRMKQSILPIFGHSFEICSLFADSLFD